MNGNRGIGMGNEESLKAGIFKLGNLQKRESLNWGIFISKNENRCLVFTSSIKRKFRHFHVVIAQ